MDNEPRSALLVSSRNAGTLGSVTGTLPSDYLSSIVKVKSWGDTPQAAITAAATLTAANIDVPADSPAYVPDRVEALRIACLRATRILDTPAEAVFDRLVFIAAQVFRAPIALISLLDVEREWIKARVGPLTGALLREAALCPAALEMDGPLVIEDLRADERYSGHPLVTQVPYARFYAAAAVLGPRDQRIGCLAVIDHHARTATAAQIASLVQLAHEASVLLTARVADTDHVRLETA